MHALSQTGPFGCRALEAQPCEDGSLMNAPVEIALSKDGVQRQRDVVQMFREPQMNALKDCCVVPTAACTLRPLADDELGRCAAAMARPFAQAAKPYQVSFSSDTVTTPVEAHFHDDENAVELERLMECRNLVLGIEIMYQAYFLHGSMSLNALVFTAAPSDDFLGCWKWQDFDFALRFQTGVTKGTADMQLAVDEHADAERLREVSFCAPEFFQASTMYGRHPVLWHIVIQQQYMKIMLYLRNYLLHAFGKVGSACPAARIMARVMLNMLRACADAAVAVKASERPPAQVKITNEWMASNNAFGTGLCLFMLLVKLFTKTQMDSTVDPRFNGAARQILNEVVQPLIAFSPTARMRHGDFVCKFENILQDAFRSRAQHRWRTCIPRSPHE